VLSLRQWRDQWIRLQHTELEVGAGVKQAEMKSNSTKVRSETSLKILKAEQESEITHKKAKIALEVKKALDLSEIEASKFKRIVDSIGPQTLKTISRAGPEMQVKLLKSLGLQSFMITDGSHPINLFNTAQGLIGNAGAQAH